MASHTERHASRHGGGPLPDIVDYRLFDCQTTVCQDGEMCLWNTGMQYWDSTGYCFSFFFFHSQNQNQHQLYFAKYVDTYKESFAGRCCLTHALFINNIKKYFFLYIHKNC